MRNFKALRAIVIVMILTTLVPCLVMAGLGGTGAAFLYQGRLTDDTGLPKTGSFDFEFRLYDASSGGSQVGSTLSKPALDVTLGIFNTSLDFGASALDGSERWLEIRVRETGGGSFITLAPRQAVTAAPYATQVINGAIGATQLATPAAPSEGQVLQYSTTATAGVTWATMTGVFNLSGTTISNINVSSSSFVFGSSQIEDIPAETFDDNRFFYDKVKGVLYAGSFVSNGGYLWNDALTGVNATVIGRNNIAAGQYSVAMGAGNTASGLGALAFGGGNNNNVASGSYSLALGQTGNTAGGNYSFALGNEANKANSNYSIAVGHNNNLANGAYGLAMGHNGNTASAYSMAFGNGLNNAAANFSLAFGHSSNEAAMNYTVALGHNGNRAGSAYSIALGYNYNRTAGEFSIALGNGSNIADGDFSFALGRSNNSTIGDYTMAIGNNFNFATGNYSLAIGSSYNNAEGNYSLAIGSGENRATGSYSTARGSSLNTASGNYSLAQGSNENIASGNYALAFGNSNNKATGTNSLAFGSNENHATGTNSAVIGRSNIAAGNSAIALGEGNRAPSYGEIAVGLWSTNYTPASATSFAAGDRLFVVGNGLNTTERSDALVILKSGDATLYGNLNVTSAVVSVHVSTGSIQVGSSATVISDIIKRTVNVDLPSVAAGASADVAISVPGATTGATVHVSPAALLTAGLIISSVNASADNVHIRLWNASGGTIDMAAQDFYITVIK